MDPFCKLRGSAATSKNWRQSQTKPPPHPHPKSPSKTTKAKLQLKTNVPNKIFLPALKAPPSNEVNAPKEATNLGPRRMGYIETGSKKPRISSIFDECRNYNKESNLVQCDWGVEDAKDSVSCTLADNESADNRGKAIGHIRGRNSRCTEKSVKDTEPKTETCPTPIMSLEAKEEPSSTSTPTESPKEKVNDDDDDLQTQKLKLGKAESETGITITETKNFKLDSIALCASCILLAPLFSYMVVKILKAAART